MENGAGFNIMVVGGVSSFTLCIFQEQNGISSANGVGQVFFVIGK